MAETEAKLPERQPVYGKDGKVVGWTIGPPPPVEKVNAADLIELGLRHAAEKTRDEMAAVAETMGVHAKEARAIFDRTSQWTFAGQITAGAKIKVLKAKFEEGQKKLTELRPKLSGYIREPEFAEFLQAVDAHVGNLKRHFTPETPALNRF